MMTAYGVQHACSIPLDCRSDSGGNCNKSLGRVIFERFGFKVTGASVVVCASSRPDMRTKPVSIGSVLSARGVARYDIICYRGVL